MYLPLNRLSVKVTVTGGDVRAGVVTATGSTTAWVVSWGYVVLVLLITIGFGLWRRRRQRNREPDDEELGAQHTEELVGA